MKNLVSILYLNLVLQFTPLSYIDAVVMNNMNIFIGISVLHSVRMDGRRRRCGQHGLGYPFSPPEKKRKTKRFSLYHSTGMIVNSMNVCRNIALSTYRTLSMMLYQNVLRNILSSVTKVLHLPRITSLKIMSFCYVIRLCDCTKDEDGGVAVGGAQY